MIGGGETKEKRNTIHVLIIGDPGIAKTQLLKGLEKIAVKYITAAGEGSSGKGLTAITRQTENGQWIVEAGALALANNGYVFQDEIDKMSIENQEALNTPLESGIIHINRAGINTTLKANTTFIAFGNPKNRRFTKYKSIAEQLNILDDLKSRFDLIYAIEDQPNKEKDRKIGKAIATYYLKDDLIAENSNILDSDILKKYILYAKTNYNPYLLENTIEYLENKYTSNRNDDYDPADEILNYEARDLESIIRLSGAIAKIKFKNEITINEIKEAEKIQNYYLKNIGIDPITNKVDIAKAKGIPETPHRRQRAAIRKIVASSIKESINKGLGIDYIEKRELKELFIERTGYKATTFNNRFKELKESGELIIKGKKVYLKDLKGL